MNSHFHLFTEYPIDLIDKLQGKSSPAQDPVHINRDAEGLKFSLVQEQKSYSFQEQLVLQSEEINFAELVSEDKVPRGENQETIVEDLREYG